jgi:hypothetical protein
MLARNMDEALKSFLADPLGTAGLLVEYGLKGATPLAVALAVMMAVVAGWLWRRRSSQRARTNVLTRRAFSQAEGQLWTRLNSALPGHLVAIGVPLTRFIAVRKDGGLGRKRRRLEALSADFAVFRSDGTVSTVVLLEDGEATLGRRQAKLRRKLLERAGLRSVTWSVASLPTVDAIARQLNPAPIQFAAGESGSAKRNVDGGSARRGSSDLVDPDTRLVASVR